MKHEIKYILSSKRFFGAVLLMLVGFTGYAIFDWIIALDFPPEYKPSSLQQTIGGIFFGGVMVLLPLCSSIPAAFSQVEEYSTSFIDQAIIRSSILSYTLRKLVTAFIIGAVVMGASFAIHAIAWNIVATPCDISTNEAQEIVFSPNCLYYQWQPVFYSLPIYISIFLGISFCGGMWSVVGVTAACYLNDKLLSVATPFCIFYLWHTGLFRILFGITNLPHPADLFNDSLTVEVILQSLVVYGVIFLVSGSLLFLRLRRRYKHAH